jgi:flavin-dependent dehydrogenase
VLAAEMNKPINRRIRIYGAGISGLTAAINLALRGYEVVVLEKNEKVVSHSKGDFQALENWTSSKDILTFLNEINIRTDFAYEPFRECTLYDRNLKKYTIKSRNVGFYLIRRGRMEGSLDLYLGKIAEQTGVTIQFSYVGGLHNADIIATGANIPFLIGAGINFNTNIDKVALAIFDHVIAPLGYAYLLGFHGRGTVAVVSKAGTKRLSKYLERAVDRFSKIMSFQINDPVKFGGYGTCFERVVRGAPLIGEAGGFQDALWGFGLRMAFYTGFLAAKALSENLDYWSLVEKEVVPFCKSSIVNRLFYDLLRSKRYQYILSRISKADDPLVYANKLYAPTRFKRLLFPLAKKLLSK